MEYELTTRATIRNIGTELFRNYELNFSYTMRYNGVALDGNVIRDGYRSFQEAKNVETIMSDIVRGITQRINISVVHETTPPKQSLGA